MFIATGLGPYNGQAVHFRHFAPKEPGLAYADRRYQFEAERHFGILDAELAGRRYLMGETYTILDMAAWGWVRLLPFVIGEEKWAKLPHLRRHFDEINARPAAARALALKDRFTFKAELDSEARGIMFRHTLPA
jgi:GST-like protein